MATTPSSPFNTIKGFSDQVEAEARAKQAQVKYNEDEVKRLQAKGKVLKKELGEIERRHKQWVDTVDKLEEGRDARLNSANSKGAVDGDESEESTDTEVGTQLPKSATLKRSSMRTSLKKRQRIVASETPTSTPAVSIPFSASGTNNPDDVYLQNATTIIKDPAGDDIEIWCGICGSNVNTGSSKLIVGWKGMHEHISNEHGAESRARPRISESAFELVYRLSRHRYVPMDEVEAIEAGESRIELVGPRRTQESVEEKAIPIRTPVKQDGAQNVGGISKKSRTKRVECHNCLTKFRANEPHLKCRYCSLVVCSLQGCQDDLESAVGHDECRKEPEEQSVDDFKWVGDD